MQARQEIVGHPTFENTQCCLSAAPFYFRPLQEEVSLGFTLLGKPFLPLPLGSIRALSPQSVLGCSGWVALSSSTDT